MLAGPLNKKACFTSKFFSPPVGVSVTDLLLDPRRLALLSDSERMEYRCQACSADDPSLTSNQCLAPARWKAGTGRMTLDRFG
jgi:hypothetical protein